MNHQHNYNSLDEYLKKTYNQKVFKVALNGNFTCPNRDGTVGVGGCIFCSASGSGDFAGKPKDSLEKQFNEVKDIISLKWPNSLYIAYFQANTNTYGPIEKLKSLFEKAITLNPSIVVLSIATRPDCLDDEVINYLSSLNKRIKVWVELGLQTVNDNTAKIINRGYTTSVFYEIIEKLRKENIDCIVHIINGLPNETKQEMLDTAKALSKLDIQGIKIHSLCILKNTVAHKMYLENRLFPLTLEEYVDITATQIAMLNPNIIIHRVGADAAIDDLIAPLWTRKKLVVMNEIDKYMKAHNLYQGSLYEK